MAACYRRQTQIGSIRRCLIGRWPAVIDERDLDFVTSPEAKQLLLNCGVRLTTWRELTNLFPSTS